MARYDQCDDTCTTDCGHCKGAGKPETTPFVPNTALKRQEALGHLVRKNHTLAGHYVTTGGISTLVRTCCGEGAKPKVEIFTVTKATSSPSATFGASTWLLEGYGPQGPRTASLGTVLGGAKYWFAQTVFDHLRAGDATEYPIVIEGGMARAGNYGIFAEDLVFQN